MIINVEQKHNEIKQDLINNQIDIFNLYNYYTHKYRGDLLNDVNLGLLLDEYQRPVAQIFVRNKTGYMKTKMIFNRDGNKIIGEELLNYKLKNE